MTCFTNNKFNSGCGGAPCILCEYREGDWKDEEKIKNGFPITRTAELIQAIFQEITAGDTDLLSLDSRDRLGSYT